ncbi:Npun_F0296 family exosortase-dependent surface protein [Agarivorans sp. QJM3NY_25]|uniref:Npun_F0296 family exosortase-dependent surface protein n=1 Tax=Agarivorans sp. QJM3NY_25 TaxID=3421430 RepID=UPI003D7C661F
MQAKFHKILMQLTLCSSILTTVFTSLASQAGVIYSIEKPGIQSSQVSGLTLTEDFDQLSNNSLAKGYQADFGYYSVKKGTAKIHKFGVYGGAFGEGKYLFIPNNSAVKLSFDQAVGYFGFWWSAGDSGNQLSITTKSENLMFATHQILDAAVLEPEHYGSPTRVSGNKREPYGYVNLFAETEADKIVSIEFFGRNFETDNHTTSIQRERITGLTLAAVSVPEPKSSWLIGLGLLLLMIRQTRCRQRTEHAR